MRPDVTRMLDDLAAGRKQAASELLPAVYAELRKLAAAQLARLRPGQTLQATALVHEAYLAMVGDEDPRWNGRGHFFGAASQAMREIIVEHVRRKTAKKRGGGRPAEDLDAVEVAASDLGIEDVLAVDAALRELESAHPRKAQVVVMRYFGGLSEEEIAAALGVTPRTVEREWRFARAFLHEVLARGGG
jgi:RNA polymerase sigma factor (TIGR02999 family)